MIMSRRNKLLEGAGGCCQTHQIIRAFRSQLQSLYQLVMTKER